MLLQRRLPMAMVSIAGMLFRRAICTHILRAIGRAWGWRRRIGADEFNTVRDLAVAVGLAERHVSRQLRLAYLAPEVLKRLVFDREVTAITVMQLTESTALPWPDQAGVVFCESWPTFPKWHAVLLQDRLIAQANQAFSAPSGICGRVNAWNWADGHLNPPRPCSRVTSFSVAGGRILAFWFRLGADAYHVDGGGVELMNGDEHCGHNRIWFCVPHTVANTVFNTAFSLGLLPNHQKHTFTHTKKMSC